MSIRRTHRFATALAASGCIVGVAASAMGAGASAEVAPQAPQHRASTSPRTEPAPAGGQVSMSSPFVAGKPHVPASVQLVIGPGGEAAYVGPGGSIFNGPAAEVDARVDEWWAAQMAAGVSPEDADELLAHLQQ